MIFYSNKFSIHIHKFWTHHIEENYTFMVFSVTYIICEGPKLDA